MLYHIRPWKVFDLVEEQSALKRGIWMKLPKRRISEFADYSLRSLELELLAAALMITRARVVFEIGTFCGNTTLHLAANSQDCEVFTLDAPEEVLEKARLTEGYSGPPAANLAELYEWRKQFPMEFAGTPWEKKIICLKGDSRTFDFSRWYDSVDVVLIDGDHSREAVDADSWNAYRMARPNRGIIAWHDYGNPDCRENTEVIELLGALNKDRPLFHVEDSMLVFEFMNPAHAEALLAMGQPSEVTA